MGRGLLQHIAVNRFPPVRVILLAAGVFVLGACTTRQVTRTTPPPLLNSTPAEQVADVDVLAMTPDMHAFMQRYILPYSNPETRLRLLVLAINSSGVLGFDYDESRTLTAAEAFRTRSGNCIGFANMMVALAREAGLKASYQEVYRQPEWSSRDDTFLLLKHINVVVSSPKYTYELDISGVKLRDSARRRVITDHAASALYFNNIGAEALLENQLPMAWAYLAKSIDTAPSLTDPWVNLGVVLGRNEQLDEAEFAYQTALQLDNSDFSAMSNLYEIYLQMEDVQAAESLHNKVENYRRKNPYYLMKLSEEALEQARFEDSINLLERAIRKQDNDHQLHFALARTQYLSGETTAANSSLLRARQLAPQDMLAHYNRPLKELVLEY